MEQHFTFLSGLSSKRAKSLAKQAAKASNTSLVSELNKIAIEEYGMDWATAVEDMTQVIDPIINLKDVETILNKHPQLGITRFHNDAAPAEERELELWKSKLLDLNVICAYLQNFPKKEINENEEPKDIANLLMLKEIFNRFQFKQMPLSSLAHFADDEAFDEVQEGFLNIHQIKDAGLFILAAMHVGFTYIPVPPNLSSRNLGHINLFNSDLWLYDADKLIEDSKNSLIQIGALFAHTGVSNFYYPWCVESIKNQLKREEESHLIVAKITPKALGITLIGTETALHTLYDDLYTLYEFDGLDIEDSSEEGDLRLALTYDLRKAFMGERSSKMDRRTDTVIFSVSIFVPVLMVQIHTLYRLMSIIGVPKNLKARIQYFIDTVLDAVLERSEGAHKDLLNWYQTTAYFHEDDRFDYINRTCVDYMTKFKSPNTRLKNLVKVLNEFNDAVKNPSKQIETIIQRADRTFDELCENETFEW